MTGSDFRRLFLDNASVAGAGRSLYEARVDHSDCIGLAHLVTAALLCEEIVLDGSSRFMRAPQSVGDAGREAVIWAWEQRYPALKHYGTIQDYFFQRMDSSEAGPVVAHVLTCLKHPELLNGNRYDLDLVPAAYRSPGYFDEELLEEQRERFEQDFNVSISEEEFTFLKYAWRGLQYHELSKEIGITYFTNPQRAHFIAHLMVPGSLEKIAGHSSIELLVQTLAGPVKEALRKAGLEGESRFQIEVPAFLSYILKTCRRSRREIGDKVQMLRQTDEFRELRGWMAEFDAAYRTGDLSTLLCKRRKLERSFANFRYRHRVEEFSFSLIPKLALSKFLDAKLDQTLRLTLPGVLFEELLRKSYLTLLWRVGAAALRTAFPTEALAQLEPVPRQELGEEWVALRRSGSRRKNWENRVGAETA